jgi:Lrp/AsnC family leucine-responsive transcriptional regulator
MKRKAHHSIDRIDARLLALVQEDAERTSQQLARLAGTSPSSVQRRLRALRAQGVIERVSAQVAPEKVGRPFLAVVDVIMEREDVATIHDFKRRMRSTPEIMQCFHVTGDYTFTLIVNLRDMAEFGAFAERLFGANGGIQRIRTSVVISRVKSTASVPIEGSER